ARTLDVGTRLVRQDTERVVVLVPEELGPAVLDHPSVGLLKGFVEERAGAAHQAGVLGLDPSDSGGVPRSSQVKVTHADASLLGVTHDLVGHGPKLDLEPLLLEATTVRGIQPSEALHGLLGVTRTDPCLEVVVDARSEEHTSELQSRENLVCRLLLEKKNNNK